MDKNNRTRPTDRGKTTVMKEKPRTPASRPKDPRPRTGNAASREAARKERLSKEEEAVKRVQSPRREASGSRETASRQAASSERKAASRRESASKRKPAAQKQSAATAEPEPTPPKRKKKKPHRVYNTNFGFKFIIMLSVVAVIVLSMIIFFKVKHIETVLLGPGPTISDRSDQDDTGEYQVQTQTGEERPLSYYSSEEVIAASGISLDDNLLSLSKAAVASRIKVALPYVNEVQIKKQLPGTVVIIVSEFDVTYGIQDERGGWWLMSREGRILDAADEQSVRGHLTVTGMPIQVPEVGDQFKPASTEGADMSEIANKQTVVLQILPALEKTSYAKQIDRVDVSTSYDLTLWWTGGRYQIRLGTTERLEYKLQYLQTILDNGSIDNKSGIVDLTFNEDKNAHFLPFP